MAQMAMQNGQPIPDQLLENRPQEMVNDEYQKGLRQCFVGIGLAIFLGFAADTIGFGIGALVFFMACRRGKELNWLVREELEKTPYGEFYEKEVTGCKYRYEVRYESR